MLENAAVSLWKPWGTVPFLKGLRVLGIRARNSAVRYRISGAASGINNAVIGTTLLPSASC